VKSVDDMSTAVCKAATTVRYKKKLFVMVEPLSLTRLGLGLRVVLSVDGKWNWTFKDGEI